MNSVKQDMLLNEYTSNRRIQENIINVKSAAKLQNTPFKEKIKYLYHFNLSPTTVLDAPYVNNDFCKLRFLGIPRDFYRTQNNLF